MAPTLTATVNGPRVTSAISVGRNVKSVSPKKRRVVAERQRHDGGERHAEDAAAKQPRLEAEAPVERRRVGRRNVGEVAVAIEAGARDRRIAGRTVGAVLAGVALGGDRQIDDQLEPVGQAEVDAEVERHLVADDVLQTRPLRIAPGERARAGQRAKAQSQRILCVIQEELEAEIPLVRRLGAIDREDAVAVERRTKQLGIDATLCLGPSPADDRAQDDGRENRPPQSRHDQLTPPPMIAACGALSLRNNHTRKQNI